MRLLVIEDDPALRDVVRRGLTEQGHVVDTADDGCDGEALALTADYDAIVLDWNLPGKDGISLVRSLRETGASTPVLMLTSRDLPADAIEGLNAGVDDYLRKPFVFGELEARLRSITRRSAAIPSDELRVGDVVFDRATRRATRAGRRIDLTARETSFLEYFMRNAESIVSRRMLEDALWERDAGVESNVVDVYVRRLRAKLTAPGESPVLHTIRGAGYRFGT
ncbi:MAG TPA: response regulator transcription factor [Candidatus Baltobacteraceae bacterium]